MRDERERGEAKAAERKRLAEALRANLKRRKAAAAERARAETTKPGEAPPGKE